MTPYKLHLQTFDGCTACDLANTRTRMVFTRGKVPCDVLFVGEAPGESENVLGKPFIGPAGKLLDKIILRTLGKFTDPPISYALTNLVCCIPYGDNGRKTLEPDGDAIEACKPRLLDFVDNVTKPKLVVCVGKLADEWIGVESVGYKHRLRFSSEIPTITITHPAAILRANVAQKGLMIQRAMVTLVDAIETHLRGSV